jgi:Predicted membrane protein (DUF2207) C-terminal domain
MDLGIAAALLLCAVTAIAWLGLLGFMVYVTRTPSVAAGAPTQALGAESPAVVDLLTGDWRLSNEAASATLLDLAARRFVAIEEIGPELSLVRLRRNVDAARLTRYEQLVLAHVTKLATGDGVVATGALAEGSRHLGGWWRRFSGAVRDEARAEGLSEARWHSTHRTILLSTAAVPALAAGLALALHPISESGDGDPIGGFVAGFVVVFLAASWLVHKVNEERGTAEGAGAAARWTGVRTHMAAARFGDKPAAAVTIWGRPLAYAAALGIADRAVASLPISTEAHDSKAWSDFGGMWHPVQVRYRGKGLWGRMVWGRTTAVGHGLLFALMTASPVLVLSILATAYIGVPADPVSFSVLVALLLGSIPVILGIADMRAATTVTGQVVRARRFVQSRNDNSTTYRYWIAIDDGRSRTAHAYGIDAARWADLAEGDLVEARVGRWLGWMHDIKILRPSRHRARHT